MVDMDASVPVTTTEDVALAAPDEWLAQLWSGRDASPGNDALATTEALCKRGLVAAADCTMRLTLLLHYARTWSDHDLLRCVASSLSLLPVPVSVVDMFAEICSVLSSKTGVSDLLDNIFRADRTRSVLLRCIEEGPGRKDASVALVKLCYAAVETVRLDVLVSSFVRSLVIPLRRMLDDCARQTPQPLQTAVNGVMVIAARCGSQVRDPCPPPIGAC